MSITLTFPIAGPLREALDHMKDPLSTTRAVMVVVDNETLALHGNPVEATEELTHDLAKVRAQLNEQNAGGCAFVIVKLEEKQFAQIMLIPEGTKPKVKMQYAGSSAHLREESRLAIATDTHVVKVDEILPTLFGRDIAAERQELRSDKEKIQVEIAAMEIAPQKPVGLPGVANPLDDDALVAVQDVKLKKLRAAIFTVHAKGVSVDKTLPIASTATADWTSLLPAEEPRFVLLTWRDDAASTVLVYVCPEGCKPRIKMPYASSKASFVAQINHQDVKLRKSIEVGSTDGIDSVIEEHLSGPQLEDDVKPIAPKSIMPKGPRMLI